MAHRLPRLWLLLCLVLCVNAVVVSGLGPLRRQDVSPTTAAATTPATSQPATTLPTGSTTAPVVSSETPVPSALNGNTPTSSSLNDSSFYGMEALSCPRCFVVGNDFLTPRQRLFHLASFPFHRG